MIHDDDAANEDAADEVPRDDEAARQRARMRSVIAWVGPLLALVLAYLLYLVV